MANTKDRLSHILSLYNARHHTSDDLLELENAIPELCTMVEEATDYIETYKEIASTKDRITGKLRMQIRNIRQHLTTIINALEKNKSDCALCIICDSHGECRDNCAYVAIQKFLDESEL